MQKKYILWFEEITSNDVPLVGGKNASLGEMFSQLNQKGVEIPNGFALTSEAFWYYLKENKIDFKIKAAFSKFKPKSLESLKETGKFCRQLILKSEFPKDLKEDILENYKKLSQKYNKKQVDVAVRSSATAEDLPSASFAGQHETFLNVSGSVKLLKAIKDCMASLFTDRAIAYRDEKGFDHLKIALSVGIQKMVRSDLSSAGIMFSLDTETGFEKVILINGTFGIGEMIVKGQITPDQFYIFKPTLKEPFRPIISKSIGRKTKKYIYGKGGGLKEVKVSEKDQLKFSISDEEVLTLAKWALIIEEHYSQKYGKWMPQDMEWAKDGETGRIFIVQSRPETIHAIKSKVAVEEYHIETNQKPILEGIAVGTKIAQGKVKIISDISKMTQFTKGEVLVTKMTDPDWVPLMRISSAVITDEGGKTCHAAIVARELGIPCIVGSKKATKTLKNGQIITLDCSQGLSGRVFSGKVSFKIEKYNLDEIPKLPVKIMANIGAPEIAFKFASLPVAGVGLAREEFIIAEKIRIHPLALYNFNKIKVGKIKQEIKEITFGYKDKKQYFVDKLAEGISHIAAAFYPRPVILRLSDFKTNEYKGLIGGELFEGEESNPMLGFRGASRYLDKDFLPAFEMECLAIKKAREIFGLNNIVVMIPFCRTPEEGRKVVELMKSLGLEKGKDGLRVIVMCEIPSNVILAEEFLEVFDGMSIGSNDLTQLTMGMDRDNGRIAHIADERNMAVKKMISKVIKLCKEKNKYSGICGEAPSIWPEFAQFLIEQGIESISLNPESVIKTILSLAQLNKK
jgi:pyruvate, water dikinase